MRRRRWIRRSIALAISLIGAINIISAALPPLPGRIELLLTVMDIALPHAGRSFVLLSGFFLLLLAAALARGKRRAWQISVVLLPLVALAHLLKGLDVEEAALVGVLEIVLLRTRRYFLVESDPAHFRQGIVALLAGLALLLLYSLSGLYVLGTYFNRLSPPHRPGALLRTFGRRVLLRPPREIVPLSPHGQWFLNSIPLLTGALLAYGLLAIILPVRARWLAAADQEERARELLRRYGGHPMAFFAFGPDMKRFFGASSNGLIAYRLVGNIAVALGDPIAPDHLVEQITADFLDFCTRHDWRAAFYQVLPRHLPIYRRLGLGVLKLGEEALIDPRTFTLTGSAMANVRTSARHAERAGIEVRFFLSPEEIPPALRAQCAALSAGWLKRKGATAEMGFSLGRLGDLDRAMQLAAQIAAGAPGDDGKKFPVVVAIALDRQEQVQAFVSFMPIYGTTPGWTLDLMRRADTAPSGTMELLLVRAIETLGRWGAEVISLGMVALADTRHDQPPLQAQVMAFIWMHLGIGHSFYRLFRFKDKFHPRWESRYLVYDGALSLPAIALALLHAHLPRVLPAFPLPRLSVRHIARCWRHAAP